MRYRLAMVVLGLAVVALVVLFGAGSAWMVESPDVGAPTGGPIADEALEARARALGNRVVQRPVRTSSTETWVKGAGCWPALFFQNTGCAMSIG